ncbi:DUF3872 domain-containing protein [uncultured Duncaniella sp.]|uniref:DUF3872 domain-containing protein n=1 Tax=uncultured Duncaniella sp. TaxID=2768039 RepID=UPI0025A9C395|nr:DUF3872 domain-containing protein [uncultured Duncaniella sp.]
MTTNFFSRIGEIRLTKTRFFEFLIAVCAIAVSLTSCSDDLDVQQSYPFTVEVMPYADKIAKGQTVELRFEIKPEGNYTNTLYTIRYFQYDGEGSLRLVDGPVLVNNDRVLLESKTFRLNYTAKSDEAHKFLVVVEDSFNTTPWEQTFEFNSKDSGDDDSGKIVSPIVTPVNPAIR